MSQSIVEETVGLGFNWVTIDPFLFCVHHDDAFPAGNAHMGPTSSLTGRNIGMDFEGKDGWRMYHGEEVPGFPRHPHRGFETITIARQGFIDHSDSLGATARFGQGDVQWMTAGRGIVHSEMFPLLREDAGNPGELFQIWLNLPASDKMVEPHFSMFWNHAIPRLEIKDDGGKTSEVTVIAGAFPDAATPPPPPPSSWARRPEAEIAIWSIRMQPGARLTLPPASSDAIHRMLYFFRGSELHVSGHELARYVGAKLRAGSPAELQNGPEESEALILQARPIAEPVSHHGPFVMNTRAEIEQAIMDYRRTEYGGWPWPSDGPVHERDAGRFAVHADGRREVPSK